MLSKILLTSLVIIVAFFVLRQRKVLQQTKGGQSAKAAAQLTQATQAKKELSNDMRFAAYAFLTVCIGAAAAMYYFQWQEDHRILTINLYREAQLEPVSYKVFKYQLEDKSFITIQGVSVSVASSERMEILGLE